ncbi:MAG: malto-oligosyltrehalose synthase [Gemmatimonadetes bacterium]|nr:malto-oligosyltrehalose synthase [Gemmatimonadota bacterium]
MPPLIATYRLQLNADFTLHDARTRVPYLRRLGVSHLYCSPVLAASPGSTHGYDVTDPTHVSETLGGDEAFVALADAAHDQGMGIVLDIVPNHMGIGADNPYWDDLLANGRRSQYADWFDVAWRAPTKRLSGKVLVPVLGDTLEKILARGEIALEVNERSLRARYFTHSFPIAADTIPQELRGASSDTLAEWSAGDSGRRRIRELLGRQHYELAFWRTAQRDVNYRRFFDVNELICLRVERQEVFEATHRTVLRFVADGVVDGLRVDHIDGLLEPRRYLERLRDAVNARRPATSGSERFPIFVEKILAAGESLPAAWPVDGTTGYEFLTALEDVFIDPAGFAAIEKSYRRGGPANFASIAVESKRRVLRATLNADVRRIAPMLASVGKLAAWPERPIAAYAGAIVELIAALPVYRTYIDAERPEADERDRLVLSSAFARAAESAHVDHEAMRALERSLLDEWRNAEAELARARLAFVLRLQQLTGPAAAKGIEDTALYVYAPLSSRNEVGGDPGLSLEGAVERLHERLAERAERHPRSLNATNTHDTKRSADARARLDALSEHPARWMRALRRWRRWHRPLRALVKGRLAPTRTADDFIYQSLVGIWPLTEAHAAGPEGLASLRERLTAYMQKAMREAKVSTSWTDPDEQYEAAIIGFLSRVLDAGESDEFHADVRAFVATVAPQAMYNALGWLVVHLMAPGVPDLYQGDELWYAALVDPDNRRPVDWGERERLIEVVESEATLPRCERLRTWRDVMHTGELKMLIARELLAFRRERAALMSEGESKRLVVAGEHADRVVAFRRGEKGAGEAIVLVGRWTASLESPPTAESWEETWIDLGRDFSAEWRCLIHGTRIADSSGRMRVGDVFSVLPVSVLVPDRMSSYELVS